MKQKNKSQNRIELGKQSIDRLIKYKNRAFILIQLKTSYERYHIIQYAKSHRLDFETIENDKYYTKYLVTNETPHETRHIIEHKYGPGLLQRFYTRPVCYVKILCPKISKNAGPFPNDPISPLTMLN